MNKWGWLSFISETSNIENARNQQCHYDYFKEANDKKAWELFQVVLEGTDSILFYLQTNHEELPKIKEGKKFKILQSYPFLKLKAVSLT